jgi:hypothetical protein
MIEKKDVEHLKEKIAKIEEIFVEIRNHSEATPRISRKADFGQGRAEDLRAFVYLLFDQNSPSNS